MDPSSENSETISEPISPHHTRPGNVNKHPASILFSTGTIQKKCTKAKKAADDKRLKDAKAAKEQATQKDIERLALMEMETEDKANEAKASKPPPACPRSLPCPRTRAVKKTEGPEEGSPGQAVVKPTIPSEEVDPDVVITAEKMPSRITKLTMQLGPSRRMVITAVVPMDSKNCKKFAVGGQVKSWADKVAAEANKLGGTSVTTKQSSPTNAGTPPSSTFQSMVSKSSVKTAPAGLGSSHNSDIEIFADTVDNDAEKWVTVNQGMVAGVARLGTVTIAPSAGSDHELEAPLSQLRKTEGPEEGGPGQAVVKPAIPSEEVDPDVVITAKKISRPSQSLKDAIKDYKAHHAAGAKKVNVIAIVPMDGKNCKKFAVGSQVKSWADKVAAEANKLGGTSVTTKQSSSTNADTPPSSTFQSTISKSSVKTALAGLGSSHNSGIEIFAHAVDNDAEKWATVNQGMVAGAAQLGTVTIAPSVGSDHELEAPLSQLRVTSRSIKFKRKAEDIEVVSDSKPDESASDGSAMEVDERAPRDVDDAAKMMKLNSSAAKGHHTITSTSVGVKINASALPLQKRVKREEPAMLTPHAPSNTSASTSDTSLLAGDHQFHTESYLIDVVKKRANYNNKDLPVPSDHRWSRSFISTATLWCSIQPNMWSVPEEQLVSALQAIFNVEYPGIKYQVTTSGSVFSVTLQRLSEWQSGFGSTALAMLIDFFSKLDDDINIHSVAEVLKTGYAFLQEDPDSLQEEGMYHSTFLLELIASTHLSNIVGFVEVPGWDVWGMASGKNSEGVIAMASAALERAVKFIAKGTINVEQVLADMANSPDGKMKIKLPKVLNKHTGCKTSAPFQFSSANWNSDTAAYQESIRKRGQAFVHSVCTAAQAHKGTKNVWNHQPACPSL
ncbi:hypothetical protein BDN67DRAFT_1014158 [Paxillus ammoniavirescens]|nr:hypothetical protein BDN67DRAFT_1014158 [Paxillus ammoniavirescens]